MLFVRSIAGEPLRAEDVDYLRSQGAERARRGLDIASLEAAVVAAVHAGIRHLLLLTSSADVDDFGGQSDFLADVIGSVLHTQATASRARSEGFIQARSEGLDDTAAKAASFVDLLLSASTEDWHAVEEDPLAQELSSCALGVVVLAAGRKGDVRTLRAAAETVAVDHPNVRIGPARFEPVAHVVLLIAMADAAQWHGRVAGVDQALSKHKGVYFAAPTASTDLGGVKTAYELSRRNLGFAKMVPPRGRRLNLGVLQLCRILAQSPPLERINLSRAVLTPLIALKRGAELIYLLDALVAVGSYQEVQTQFGIPDRTITRYREQIEAATGFEWLDHRDRMVLTQVVLCRWLAAASPDEFNEAVWGPMPRTSLWGDS
jgi:hypothetical protein